MADGVILLHGIFRTARHMRKLSEFLADAGFMTYNLNYPSTRYPLEQLATHIHPEIEAFSATVPGRLHFVGYSMGGLLVRAYLKNYRPTQLGRVVMIGTPNHGSEVADFLQHRWLYKTLYGPAGQQLITDQSTFRHIFGPIDAELGIIAGDRARDFISSRIIGKPNDGKVSIDSTQLPEAKEQLVLSTNHTCFPTHRPLWPHVAHFLQHGQFKL